MILWLLLSLNAFAAGVQVVEVKGTINPGSASFILESLHAAETEKADLFVLQLDTPGGLLSSTRDIIQGFSESQVPVTVWVTPGGASATSAGALIALSAHVIAMSQGTNLGAAHPVGGAGEDIKGVMGEKVTNDTAALARSQAVLHGRKPETAEQIVTKSRSFSSKEALEAGMADVLADDTPSLLKQLSGRKVTIKGSQVEIKVSATSEVLKRPMTAKQYFLHLISDPNISTMLMTLAGLALWAEVSSGFSSIAAGVIGILAFVLALVSLQTLPVNTGGALLLVLGFVLLVMEAFITSFGLLTVAALISLFVGGLFLIDPAAGSMHVSVSLLVSLVAGVGTVMGVVGALLYKDRNKFAHTGMTGLPARVSTISTDGLSGTVEVGGELWNFSTSFVVAVGETLLVTETKGLTLILERKK